MCLSLLFTSLIIVWMIMEVEQQKPEWKKGFDASIYLKRRTSSHNTILNNISFIHQTLITALE